MLCGRAGLNHERAVAGAVASLRAHGMPVILVDDGSGPSCAAVLEHLAASDACVRLHRLPQNQGKGAAVLAGFDLAAAAG
jgi:glycosyltransferase involved in cell wall biosynthesis